MITSYFELSFLIFQISSSSLFFVLFSLYSATSILRCVFNPRSKLFYLIYVVELFFGFFGILCISSTIISLSMSSVLHVWFVFPLIFLIWFFSILHFQRRQKWKKNEENDVETSSDDDANDAHIQLRNERDSMFYDKIKNQKFFKTCLRSILKYPRNVWLGVKSKFILLCFGVVIIAGITSISVFFTSNCCVNIHPLEISTSFTRKLGQSRICKPESVCHAYFTVPEDLSTSMSFQFQFNF
jgi:hypothetical protein